MDVWRSSIHLLAWLSLSLMATSQLWEQAERAMLSPHGTSLGPLWLMCPGACCWLWVEGGDGASLTVPIQKLAGALLHCPPWQKNRWELKGKQDVVFSFSWCCSFIRSLSCPLIASLIACLPYWWIRFSFLWFCFQEKLRWADPLDILYLLRPSVCMRTLLADISVCVASTLKRFQYSSWIRGSS